MPAAFPHILLTVCLPLTAQPLALRRVQPDAESAVAEDPSSSDPQLDRAMESYALGTQAYNAARYEDALGHFKAAATLYASADFQYNIGLCHERLGERAEAIRAFKTYLRAKPDAPDRPAVEDRIFNLQRELEAEAAQAGKDESAPQRAADTNLQASGDASTSDTSPNRSGRTLRIVGYAALGAGAALALGGGLGFGIAASSRSNDVQAITNDDNPDDLRFADAESLDQEGRRFETLQITAIAVGSALAIGGAAMLAVGTRQKRLAWLDHNGLRAGMSATPSSAHITLGGHF